MINKFKQFNGSVVAGGLMTMGFIGSSILTYQYLYKDPDSRQNYKNQQTVQQFILNKNQHLKDDFLLKYPIHNQIQNNKAEFQKVDQNLQNTPKNTDLFSKIVDQCFEACDYDGNGTIDERELYIALLLLYDRINRQLPCNIPVPKRIQVQQYMQQHDKNGDNQLDKEEFREMASKMFFQSEKPYDSVFFNIAVGIFIYVVGLPFMAHYLKKFIIQIDFSGTKYVEKIPVAVLAGIIGVIIPFIQTGIMYQNYIQKYQTDIDTT